MKNPLKLYSKLRDWAIPNGESKAPVDIMTAAVLISVLTTVFGNEIAETLRDKIHHQPTPPKKEQAIKPKPSPPRRSVLANVQWPKPSKLLAAAPLIEEPRPSEKIEEIDKTVILRELEIKIGALGIAGLATNMVDNGLLRLTVNLNEESVFEIKISCSAGGRFNIGIYEQGDHFHVGNIPARIVDHIEYSDIAETRLIQRLPAMVALLTDGKEASRNYVNFMFPDGPVSLTPAKENIYAVYLAQQADPIREIFK